MSRMLGKYDWFASIILLVTTGVGNIKQCKTYLHNIQWNKKRWSNNMKIK
jgi:hypothetical protein